VRRINDAGGIAIPSAVQVEGATACNDTRERKTGSRLHAVRGATSQLDVFDGGAVSHDHSKYDKSLSERNPVGSAEETGKLTLRDGGLYAGDPGVRCASRLGSVPINGDGYTGFRLLFSGF
jgi:hypothetical protein